MAESESPYAVIARRFIDAKAKPPGSLGVLEDWAVKTAALQNTLSPRVVAARLVVFAADHGTSLSNPGVSAYPRSVSASIFKAIARGHAASATLCKANDCSLHVVDVGLDAPPFEPTESRGVNAPVQCSASQVRRGSRDMLAGPAMLPDESARAQAVGRAAVRRYLCDMSVVKLGEPSGVMALCVGELGIGNTTSAAAIVAAFTGRAPIDVCGRGTGLDDAGVLRKATAITRALEVNESLVKSGDPHKILEAVGGLEFAAMVGAYLEAAAARLPVLVDGFVAGAAALVALHMNAGIAKSLFWSHHSEEKGTVVLLEAVAAVTGVKPQPALTMGLRLGEGTGAVLALPLLRSACAIMTMATLEEALSAEHEKDKGAEKAKGPTSSSNSNSSNSRTRPQSSKPTVNAKTNYNHAKARRQLPKRK